MNKGIIPAILFIIGVLLGEFIFPYHYTYVIQATSNNVTARVGDIVQIQPFEYPVIPKYLNSHLETNITSEYELQYIGEVLGKNGDGSNSKIIFIKAIRAGTSSIHMSLLDKDNNILRGPVVYKVNVR